MTLAIDIQLAGREPNSSERYLVRGMNAISQISDALEMGDFDTTAGPILDLTAEIADSLSVDPRTVFFQILDITGAMDRAITQVVISAGELMGVLDDALRRPGGHLELAVERGRALDKTLNDLLFTLSDFTRADLREVDLSAISLAGVLWSERTQWPPDAAHQVARDSDRIGTSLYVVREAAPDQRDAWTVSRAEAEHIARLWATAAQSSAYPLIGSVVAEFDLGYVLTEALPPDYAPLSRPRRAVVDRETGDLSLWLPAGWSSPSVEEVIERFRAWRAGRPRAVRTWDQARHENPTHVTYLRLPALDPNVADRWIRACGVDGGQTQPEHHPLVGHFLDTLAPDQRRERCAQAAAMSDALYTEDVSRAVAGLPPITLDQARHRLFANASSLTYELRGPGGPPQGKQVPVCASCDLLVRHFSYQAAAAATGDALYEELKRLAERNSAGEPDLDAAIKVLRQIRRAGPDQEVRDTATEKLFQALLQRYRDEGNLGDLNDVIEMHQVDTHRLREQSGRSTAPVAPGTRWAEEAYRQRAEITGSSVDHTIAATMRWFGRGSDEAKFDITKVVTPEGYTVRAAKARQSTHPNPELAAEVRARIAQLRAEPGLGQRVDLLDELTDALGGLSIATDSAEALDDLIEASTLLLGVIPEHDIHHRVSHRFGLGVQLFHRYKDMGGGVDDARQAFAHLEYAATAEALETHARISSARAAGMIASDTGDRQAAARMFQLAVGLLPKLVPQHLSPADHARLLAPMAGLVSEAATTVLHAGDPGGALELLEEGRGLLIGHALDARAGTTEKLRGIADGLATSLDPHADREPGQPSTVDRRRELGREWDREVARIRTLPGFEDYLRPARVAELAPLAATGPVVTIVVSGQEANALVLTTGGVDVIALPDLTGERVDEMTDTFWGVLPFAELAPDDRDGTIEAQEPLRRVLAQLWQSVAAPVLDRVGRTERIWWVPTGMLAALPLHAAGDGQDSVLDRVVSSYAPTIKVLRASRSRAAGASDAACVVAVADVPGMPALPQTRTEALQVTRRFADVAVLDGPAATPDAVVAAVARSGWVHLACHATTNVSDPAHCALHVHGGVVTARAVMTQRASGGRLAYLSCCRTAMANGAQVVDEMIHFGSAFQIAGFRHVVGTLWQVKDAMAARAAELFYDQVGSTEDRAPRALHDTVLRLRERDPLLPARWAPYVHLGG